jgi:hypothetical protein
MGNRCDIRNGPDFHPGRLDGADGIFAARAGALDDHIHFLDAHRLGTLTACSAAKRAANRPQDQADIEFLTELERLGKLS